ncbi:MAG TPA: hypothetical protein VI033_05365 [Candidatus Nitrosopolaris sp.]
MLSSLVQRIIYKYITSGIKCTKILAEAGITTKELVISQLDGLSREMSVNINLLRGKYPNITRTASIAKNLDEYQFLVCREISSIPDFDPMKIQLQKYRVGVIAAFARLVAILEDADNLSAELEKWNSFANSLLVETSETLLKARNKMKKKEGNNNDSNSSDQFQAGYSQQNLRIKEALNFFGVPENDIDEELIRVYSGNTDLDKLTEP